MPKFLQFASITKKVTLALIGIFLMLFLVVHMGINLCMLRNDGGEWFRAAAHFMGTNYFVKVFEIVLFAAVIGHIVLAAIITIQNRMARPVGYKSRSKTKTKPASKLMMWTGIVIFLFMGMHFVNFYFVKIGLVEGRYSIEVQAVEEAFAEKDNALRTAYSAAQTDEDRANVEAEMADFQAGLEAIQTIENFNIAFQHGDENIVDLSKAEITEIQSVLDVDYEADFYAKAHYLFKNVWVVLIYTLAMIALGFHLTHAFQSVFQTLGLAHSKYTPAIRIIGTLFAIGISVGFAIIPLYFFFFK